MWAIYQAGAGLSFCVSVCVFVCVCLCVCVCVCVYSHFAEGSGLHQFQDKND